MPMAQCSKVPDFHFGSKKCQAGSKQVCFLRLIGILPFLSHCFCVGIQDREPETFLHLPFRNHAVDANDEFMLALLAA